MTQKNGKLLLASVLVLSSLSIFNIDVFADNSIAVSSADDLKKAVIAGNDIQLGSDIIMPADRNYFSVGTAAGNTVVDLDLNGHTLTMNGTYIVVENGADLRIFNGQKDNEGSVIKGTNGVFEVKDGTVTIDGGTFDHNNHVIRAVNKSSNVTINAGNFTNNGVEADNGGAIAMNAGTLTVNGGTFNGNIGTQGGAVKADNSAVTVNGGDFKNNTASWTGGAVNLWNSTFTMNAGTMEYNTSNAKDWATGGGAVWAGGSSTVNLLGGTFDHNYAYASGGAVLFSGSKMQIGAKDGSSSPVISNNTSKQHEGGGLALIMGNTIMYAASLTGNAAGYNLDGTANTDFYDWGGGAVFVADQGFNQADNTFGASLYIPTATVIKDNIAGGFGGGIAGCSTGRIVLSTDGESGAAVFDNTADMKHVSGSTSAKNEDHTFGLENKEFMADGADDYFCAFNSSITNKMLGGYANWTGSVDGEKYTASGDELVTSTSVAGLKAQNTYSGTAMVTITNNKSYTHGGGILSNGYLVLGKPSSIEVGKPVELIASKSLLGTDGTAMSTMDGKTFTFSLVDDSTNQVVATGTTDANGKISFNNRLTFSGDNCKGDSTDFTYTLTETAGDDKNVSYDASSIKLTITVLKNTASKILEDGTTLTHTWYTIGAVTAKKNEETIAVDVKRNTDESHSCILTLGAPTFTNQELAQISVTKKFDDNNNQDGIRVVPTSADFELEQNGKPLSSTAEVADNQDGTYTISYKGLTPLDETGTAYQYAVKEINTHGYTAVYAAADQQAAYDQETIVNTHVPEKTTGSLVIKKTFAGDDITADQKKNLNFEVKGPNGFDQKISYADPKFVNGTYTFSDVASGNYTVIEKNPEVTGYRVTVKYTVGKDQTSSVKVTAKETAEIDILDTYKKPFTPTTSDKTESPKTSEKTETPTTSDRPSTPKTADCTDAAEFAGILAFAIVLGGIAIVLRKKYSN